MPPPPLPPPRYRRPSAAPTPRELAEDEAWREYSEQSLDRARSSAEEWRTGLGVLVTVIAGGLILKGPSSTADLTTVWRAALTAALATGFAGALYGLWRAVRAAAAGGTEQVDRDAVRAKYGSLGRYKAAAAARVTADLRVARVALLISLPLVVAATLASWWAPRHTATAPAAPPGQLFVVVVSSGEPLCGEVLLSVGRLTVRSALSRQVQHIPFDRVGSMTPTSSCAGAHR
ncbi:hypothetical protein ACFCX4_01875 [Kitasatospora sp. NPDC056327]|uniref:hypothetical protein n=1 Tax=Kitasatospora sp. NPDC056327 TaxID=3345785 RepID=UPI0035DFB7C8